MSVRYTYENKSDTFFAFAVAAVLIVVALGIAVGSRILVTARSIN